MLLRPALMTLNCPVTAATDRSSLTKSEGAPARPLHVEMTLDDLAHVLSVPAWPDGVTPRQVIDNRFAHADKWKDVLEAPYDTPVMVVSSGKRDSELRPATRQNLYQIMWCNFVRQKRIRVQWFLRESDARAAFQKSA